MSQEKDASFLSLFFSVHFILYIHKVYPFVEVLPAAFQVQAVYRAMRRDNRMKYFL